MKLTVFPPQMTNKNYRHMWCRFRYIISTDTRYKPSKHVVNTGCCIGRCCPSLVITEEVVSEEDKWVGFCGAAFPHLVKRV